MMALKQLREVDVVYMRVKHVDIIGLWIVFWLWLKVRSDYSILPWEGRVRG